MFFLDICISFVIIDNDVYHLSLLTLRFISTQKRLTVFLRPAGFLALSSN